MVPQGIEIDRIIVARKICFGFVLGNRVFIGAQTKRSNAHERIVSSLGCRDKRCFVWGEDGLVVTGLVVGM